MEIEFIFGDSLEWPFEELQFLALEAFMSALFFFWRLLLRVNYHLSLLAFKRTQFSPQIAKKATGIKMIPRIVLIR